MAQGKLKLKTKVPKNAKKGGGGGGASGSKTKGAFGGGVKKPKSKKELQLSKFKKEIRKNINKSIEQQLGKKANQVEDRSFHCAELNTSIAKKKK